MFKSVLTKVNKKSKIPSQVNNVLINGRCNEIMVAKMIRVTIIKKKVDDCQFVK